jgi:hypothetical protein
MQVVEMLFRNFVAGNFTDNCDKCWLSSVHNGILHKHKVPGVIQVIIPTTEQKPAFSCTV